MHTEKKITLKSQAGSAAECTERNRDGEEESMATSYLIYCKMERAITLR